MLIEEGDIVSREWIWKMLVRAIYPLDAIQKLPTPYPTPMITYTYIPYISAVISTTYIHQLLA